MQVHDEEKRERIRKAAAELFATRPFHKVRLDDVAAAAGVGKGTLYVYFESKEALFTAVVFERFARLVNTLESDLSDEPDAASALSRIVADLVAHAFENPHVFQLMRTMGIPAGAPIWREKHERLTRLIAETIRRGVESGCFQENRPELTALYVPGLIRSALLYGADDLTPAEVTSHVRQFLSRALLRR